MIKEQCCHHKDDECLFERVNYHFGQMMMVDDFRDQQEYYNDKRWMLNRFGFGWGTMHGLGVTVEDSCVVIHPGFALTKDGHEILVCEAHKIDLCKWLADHEIELERCKDLCLYVLLKYRERETQPFQLPVDECDCHDSNCAYRRTREEFCFELTRDAPKRCPEPIPKDEYGCEIDCCHLLEKPNSRSIHRVPKRVPCFPIPLAKVCYVRDCTKPGHEYHWRADNTSVRQSVYSTNQLLELILCVKEELWKAHSAKYDRRRHVPLLAQTIKGVCYEDGTVTKIDDVGIAPWRVTTDGEALWITDRGKAVIHRVARRGNRLVVKEIKLHDVAWGIAFDGRYMWVTHPRAREGDPMVSRINICDYRCEPDEAPCRPEPICVPDLCDHPMEIVFDGEYLWVSHANRVVREIDDCDEPKEEKDENHADDKEYRKGNLVEKAQIARQEKRPQRIPEVPLRISRFDPGVDPDHCDPVCKVELPTDHISVPVAPIVAMVFDGRAVWVTYNDSRSNAYAQRVPVRESPWAPRRLHKECYPPQEEREDRGCPESCDPPIELRGCNAKDIAFDGTHVWVAHDQGASKISLTGREIKTPSESAKRSSAVFDGTDIWLGQNRGSEASVDHLDIFSCDYRQGYELRCQKGEEIWMNRLCFDGTFIWVVGFRKAKGDRRGLVHRLLP